MDDDKKINPNYDTFSSENFIFSSIIFMCLFEIEMILY